MNATGQPDSDDEDIDEAAAGKNDENDQEHQDKIVLQSIKEQEESCVIC